MNETKQRIKIAEACGWKTNQYGKWFKDGIVGPNGFVPDYLNDLNAMTDAVDSLPYAEQIEWVYKLGEVLGFRNRNEWTELALIQTTAKQRAEAFIRTLERMEEDNETN